MRCSVGSTDQGGQVPADLTPMVERIANDGGTPLVVAEGNRALGVIHLKDTVKTGIAERFAEMRAIGIRTVMITGDNPLTAAAIAKEAGRRRLHGRGDTGRQDGTHPRRAGRRKPRGDDG